MGAVSETAARTPVCDPARATPLGKRGACGAWCQKQDVVPWLCRLRRSLSRRWLKRTCQCRPLVSTRGLLLAGAGRPLRYRPDPGVPTAGRQFPRIRHDPATALSAKAHPHRRRQTAVARCLTSSGGSSRWLARRESADTEFFDGPKQNVFKHAQLTAAPPGGRARLRSDPGARWRPGAPVVTLVAKATTYIGTGAAHHAGRTWMIRTGLLPAGQGQRSS